MECIEHGKIAEALLIHGGGNGDGLGHKVASFVFIGIVPQLRSLGKRKTCKPCQSGPKRGTINRYQTKGGGRLCSTASGRSPSSSAWACVWQHFLRPLPCSSRSMATSPEQCRQYRTRRWAASTPSAAFRAVWKALFPCWRTTAGRTASRRRSLTGCSRHLPPATHGSGASVPA